MSQVNLPFPVNELASALCEKLLPHLHGLKPKETLTTDKYFTRKETAKQLNVSLPTLNEYTKRCLITSYRFGVRVMYKQSDIETALTKIDYRRADHGK